MIRTTPGELLINKALPEGLRRHGRVLDSAGIKDLFQELAEKHPDQYRDVAAKLVRLAGDFAFEKGGLSFGVRHLRPARAALLRRMKIRREIDAILDAGGPDESAREKKILDLLESHRAPLEKEVFDESLAEDNPLARQVVSGVRGNKTNLRSLRGMDLTYVDHRDRAIPIPILRSYSEGLSPAEYWAGAYGARKGVIDVKDATAQVGFLGKQLTAAAHKLIATARDSDEPDEVASLRGMPADASDPDNVGALLARAAGGYPRNTVITPRVLKDLQDKGVSRMLVRSPIVGGPAGGGVYARDVGVREKGKLPPVGDYVGHAAAQALSEKLLQGSLCLAAGTLVRMADGTTRRIEDVRVGDMVLGADRTGRGFPVRVRRVFDNGTRRVRRWRFQRWRCDLTKHVDLEVTCTVDHKILTWFKGDFYSRGGPYVGPIERVRRGGLRAIVCTWADFTRLRAEDRIRLGVGSHPSEAEFVRSESAGEVATHDIEVDHPDHLFVLANGLIVSNSSKHSGGVAGAGGAVSGFKAVERMVNPPKAFPGAAAHAQVDGRVTAVEDAPQGGRYVWIGPEKHYVPPGVEATARVGDEVEAGDVLSEGVPNPAEIVRHKGVGEGRRYFVDAMRDVYKRSGMQAHRRNIEILARGLVDHVTLDAEAGDWVPGDVVPYSSIEASWTPRPESSTSAPRAAIGRYLEKPVLHYTIGTKVRPSVARSLEEFGVGDVLVHRDPPPFSPTMIRGVSQSQHDPDWAARQLGSGATKATLEAARRGAVADAAGPSFVAPLVLDPAAWNRSGKTVGWDPKEAAARGVLDDLLDDDPFGLED